MPWDSTDKWRHEDELPDKRKRSRRRFRLGGRRGIDNHKTPRLGRRWKERS